MLLTPHAAQAIQEISSGGADHLYRILEITVPVLLFMWANKRAAKKDVERRHQENQELITRLSTERKYFKPHMHSEKEGPLTVEGLTYPPSNDH
jgi:hypothetical protein